MKTIIRTILAFTLTYVGCVALGESHVNSMRVALVTGLAIGYLFDLHGLILKRLKSAH